MHYESHGDAPGAAFKDQRPENRIANASRLACLQKVSFLEKDSTKSQFDISAIQSHLDACWGPAWVPNVEKHETYSRCC